MPTVSPATSHQHGGMRTVWRREKLGRHGWCSVRYEHARVFHESAGDRSRMPRASSSVVRLWAATGLAGDGVNPPMPTAANEDSRSRAGRRVFDSPQRSELHDRAGAKTCSQLSDRRNADLRRIRAPARLAGGEGARHPAGGRSCARTSGAARAEWLDKLAGSTCAGRDRLPRSARARAALPPWRELLQVYRGMEARGEIRGGRSPAFSGEQFALRSGGRGARRAEASQGRRRARHRERLRSAEFVGVLTPRCSRPGDAAEPRRVRRRRAEDGSALRTA